MKNIKSIILVAFTLLAGLSSCKKGDYWTKAELSEATYSFPSATSSFTFAPADEMTKAELTVLRTSSVGDVTIPVSVSASQAAATALEFPAEISFKDGETTACYSIGIAAQFNFGQSVSAIVKFDKSQFPLSPAGVDSTKVTIKLDYNWKSLGMGAMFDNFNADGEYYECEIMQAVELPTLFKAVDPYSTIIKENDLESTGNQEDVQFQIYKKGEQFTINFTSGPKTYTVENDSYVHIKDSCTGIKDGNGELWMYYPQHYTSLAADQSLWRGSYVMDWQENGLPAVVSIAPVWYYPGLGGGYNGYTIYSNIVNIKFPGVIIKDYDVSIEYTGRETDTKNKVNVCANVEAGADIDSTWVGVGLGSVESIVDALLKNELEHVLVEKGAESVKIPFTAEDSGEYSVVILGFYPKDGETAVSYDYDSFKYSTGGGLKTEFVEGAYSFALDPGCVLAMQGMTEYVLSVTKADEAGDYGEYLIDFGLSDGSQWWAEYDKSTMTLTCNGFALGEEEKYGNQFSELFAMFNQQLLYAYFAGGEAGDEPLVFDVNARTGKISGIATNFSIELFRYAQGYPYYATYAQINPDTHATYVEPETESTLGFSQPGPVKAIAKTNVFKGQKVSAPAKTFSRKVSPTASMTISPAHYNAKGTPERLIVR